MYANNDVENIQKEKANLYDIIQGQIGNKH